ncbi:hypothetical protein [Hellea balneolensis]|uniref:hypothetical protein n=1 Tax=Hellea balneolensis TaxID=287478 RepID=UPI000428B137|nr:hypothetical protein [Hellea balneolensis]
MTFSIKALLLLSGAALLVTACGNDPKAANEASFEAALNAHYAQMKQCVRVGSAPNADGIIQEFRTDGRVQDKQLSFYNGLVDLGLLDAVSYQKETKNFSGQVTGKADWVGYKFSDNGKTFLRPVALETGAFSTGARQLCYGTPQVVEIVGFTESAEVMGVKVSNVQYTYKLVDIAPWATDPALSKQHEWLPERLSNQRIYKDDDLVLTNNGWAYHSHLKK